MYFSYTHLSDFCPLFPQAQKALKGHLTFELIKCQYSRCQTKNLLLLISQLVFGGMPQLLFQLDTAF